MADLQTGDYGTIVRFTLSVDGVIDNLSTVTAKTIRFRKPNGTTFDRTASFTTDGTDGKVQYTTIAGDISIKGNWRVAARITFSNRFYETPAQTFTVADPI